MRKILQAITLVAALFIALPSWAAKEPETAAFRFRLAFEPTTLDWTLGEVPIWVIQNSMRGLYRINPQGEAIPDLVTASTHTQFKKWIFEITPQATWSDGVPLTAQHVIDGLNRLKDPRTGSSYSYFLAEMKEAKALSPHRLEISLENPNPRLPLILSHWVTYPVRQDLITAHVDYGSNPARMAFLGKYRVASWDHANRVILEPNSHFNREPKEAGALKRIEAWIVPHDNTALNLFDTGKLDLISDPGQAIGRDHRDLKTMPSPILYFIGISRKHPLAQSPEALLALSDALDRKQIPVALGVEHRPTLEFCPGELLYAATGKRHLAGAFPDARLARERLRKAGFDDPSRIPPLQLTYFNRPAIRELAEWIQAQWKKNLGLEVSLDSTDPKSYWALIAKDPPAFFLNSKGASYPDPDAFFRLLLTESPQNYGGWKDGDYDRWVKDAATEVRHSERATLYEKASRRALLEKPAIIPLYFRSTQLLIKPRIKGLVLDPLTGASFRNLRID